MAPENDGLAEFGPVVGPPAARKRPVYTIADFTPEQQTLYDSHKLDAAIKGLSPTPPDQFIMVWPHKFPQFKDEIELRLSEHQAESAKVPTDPNWVR